MPFDAPGFSYAAPVPYYAPVRQQVQPKPPAPKPVAPVAKPRAASIQVPPPEQLGIHLDDAPLVVPAPQELGIDLE
jgi:hypothetical protein